MAKLKSHKQRSFFVSFLYATLMLLTVGLFATQAFATSDPICSGGKHIIGYYPDWADWFVNSIEYDKITHLNYFSIEPYENGDLNIANITPDRLLEVVQAAGDAGVTVSITVGGGGRTSGFLAMTSDPAARSNFVQNIVDFVNEYDLDGVDLSWEPGDVGVEPDDYSTLIQELRTALGPNKLLSVAVSTWIYTIQYWAVEYVDWLAVMAYDMNWPGAEHSTYEDTLAAMNFWELLPAPKNKLVMGVPFYGRNENMGAQTYAWIVDTYNPLPSEDWAGGYYFNGIDTIKAKIAYTYENDYAGVMIWNLSQDNQGDTSLLAAIKDKIAEYTAPTPNPMTWSEEPTAESDTSISMTATVAEDPNGVEYYFACTSEQPEGSDSGWQESSSYIAMDLQPGTTYSYKVKARDTSVNNNETEWSEIESAKTTGAEVATTLSVRRIRLLLKRRRHGLYIAKAKVVVRDNFGNLVPGAEVTGTFSGDFNGQLTVTTNERGRAKFIIRDNVCRPSFTFTVDNVTHETLTYNPENNRETSDSYPRKYRRCIRR